MAKEVLRNTNSIDVVGTNLNVSTKTVNGGFSNEKKVFTFRGRLKKNKPTVIGTIHLTTDEGKRLTKSTNLNKKSGSNIKSNMHLTLKSTTKDDNGNITGHLYDVVYTAREKTSDSNKLVLSLENNPRTIRNEHRIPSYYTNTLIV